MTTNPRAVARASMPVGTERFLDTRSLAESHRGLAAMLAPGMRVLDVGCGTGAITRGIADAVLPQGTVVGIDVNTDLVARAGAAASGHANLHFEVADITVAGYRDEFDVVSAARVLQWLSDPMVALEAMVAAARPGGRIVVLDYDHTKIEWEPSVPAAVTHFYDRFLAWREDAGMDNAIADSLPDLFRAAGLRDVGATDQRETASVADADFATRIALWPGVIATRGLQIVADGMLTEADRIAAGEAIGRWIREAARRQTLHLAAVAGTKPRGGESTHG